MASYSIEGIVLRHADYRENDRMLTLLTPRGRVDALSRGCKRPKSPLLPCSEVFTLGNYELLGSKNHCVITSCLLTDSFYPLRLDIDRLSCAAYMANVCEATVQPEEDARRPFLLLARALGCLSYQSVAPRILLLDEPTKGIDAGAKQVLRDILTRLKAEGMTLLMVTHDVEFAAETADRCALFFDGEILSADTPSRFFGGNTFYTTAANRMARTLCPNAVTCGQVVRFCTEGADA